ncbi:MAG: ATP-binding cassette domain-containing protein [Anaerolineales bacterium]|nr:ATP-binding cassette domain-containing protein [Anaerolineales bacterium]
MTGSFTAGRSTLQEPILRAHNLTKQFPGVLANDSIDLDIFPGEVHALLGENGAGKSTLVKCIYGFYLRDAGEIFINGESVNIRSPHDAREHKIGMVFQDLTLIPALTIVENIALFLPDLPSVPDLNAIANKLSDIGLRYSLEVDPWALVQDLSIGQQQKAELLKLLLAEARILILDEPTRVLAPHELEGFFQVLEQLVNDNLAVILITHKLNEVLECADRITVLREGRVTGRLTRSEASESKLIKMMFEKELSTLKIAQREDTEKSTTPLLELRGVQTQGVGAETSLEQIDLEIHPGEIVGVAGVSGNGQRELGDVILGMIKCIHGTKYLFGENVTNLPVRTMRRGGVSFIPENPLTMATVPFMSVLENMALTKTRRYSRLGGLTMDWQAVQVDTENTMKQLDFSFSLFNPAKSLSGGNMQRMVIVRELSHDPPLIIASYLTRGLDVQSTTAARHSLIQARDDGAGILLISEDLEELFQLSDRLIIMHDGRIVGRFKPEGTNIYEVGHLMTGSKVEHVKRF